MTIKFFRTAVLAAATAAAAMTASSANAYMTFFGEDLNNSASVPLSSTPNASAAEASFLSHLTGVGTETFEGFAANTAGPLNLSFPGAGNATLAGGNGSVRKVTQGSTNGVGRYGINSENFWQVAAGGSGNFTVTFSAPIAAFGFYGIDIGDFGGQLMLQLNDGSNTQLTVNNTVGSSGSTDGSVLYYGFIAETALEQVTEISFQTSTGQGDYFAFDNMTIGTFQQVNVPEPSTVAVMLVGAIGIGAASRRRLLK